MENRKFNTVDEYIAAFPDEVREILEKVRLAIRKAAPGARETISYQIPTFALNGNLVHFGGFKRHIGFYPGSSGIEAFKEELAGYVGAKGSVRFPLDKPIPLGLIVRIVRFRVKENLGKKKVERKSRARIGNET
jgi:uncharacterized protein YdhG (YjbR/CyaY superfamily)